MEDREKRRAKGRINVGASSGGGFFLGVKKALGMSSGRSINDEKDDGGVGMNSIQVHVETAVATADFPNSPVRPQTAAPPSFERRVRNDLDFDDEFGRGPFGRTHSGDSEDHIIVPTLNVNGSSDGDSEVFDDDSTKGKQSNDSKAQLK
jgi:hypothetical protein